MPSPRSQEHPLILRVTAAAQRLLAQGHPWVYDRAIVRQRQEGRPGDLAVIYDHRERFAAIGLYDPTSPLRVRVLQHRRPVPITIAWYAQRIAEAAKRRGVLAKSRTTTGYRLVHGENDGLPGVVIDRYEQTLVLKLYTVVWVPHLQALRLALDTVVPSQRLIVRLSRTVQQFPQHLDGLTDGTMLSGPSLTRALIFQEHGLRFEVDPRHGQKTGFFLDQRDNRQRLEALTKGCSVLDMFSYTGGFSVYAARGGAREVTSVDLSAPALAATKRNMALNRTHPRIAAVKHDVIVGDAFTVLAQLRSQSHRYDVLILDPPAFAHARSDVPSALHAYERLVTSGVGLLRPGGTLVISCCSAQVNAAVFFETIHCAAAAVKRPLRELARTGHAIDHPIRFPQGEYLKCLFARA